MFENAPMGRIEASARMEEQWFALAAAKTADALKSVTTAGALDGTVAAREISKATERTAEIIARLRGIP
jgi:hypothetical protein